VSPSWMLKWNIAFLFFDDLIDVCLMLIYLFICTVSFGRISVCILIWVSHQMGFVCKQYELKGIFWTPFIVHLQYQISQVVYMKECMNTHCKISLYHSNRFTVYFDFFCFTWEMFSLYLYNGFCTFMVNRETVINVEKYSCQVSVTFYDFNWKENFSTNFSQKPKYEISWASTQVGVTLMCVERQAEITEFISLLLFECECT
jgi:hypothetical protein